MATENGPFFDINAQICCQGANPFSDPSGAAHHPCLTMVQQYVLLGQNHLIHLIRT